MPYVFASLLLGLVDPAVTFVINDPRGVVNANEKLYALNFSDVIPESLVSADHVRLKAFMESLGGEMIVKPLCFEPPTEAGMLPKPVRLIVVPLGRSALSIAWPL